MLVRKKNGSLRLCVDYHKLNSRTQKDSFPLPWIDESLESFNQVAVEEEDSCLRDQIYQLLLVYLDNVIVFSKTFDEHLERLDKVLMRLAQQGLKVKCEKCSFLRREVSYLGYVVSSNGVSTDPDKISIVRNWPVPKTVKELRSFLGFASYSRRFVKDFSKVAEKLFIRKPLISSSTC